jgi:hypothetical protein
VGEAGAAERDPVTDRERREIRDVLLTLVLEILRRHVLPRHARNARQEIAALTALWESLLPSHRQGRRAPGGQWRWIAHVARAAMRQHNASYRAWAIRAAPFAMESSQRSAGSFPRGYGREGSKGVSSSGGRDSDVIAEFS